MIREAILSDSNVIAEIIVETWQKSFINIIDQNYIESMDVQRFVNIMKDNIQLNKEIIFVYEENEIIKGFISGKITEYSDHQCEIVGFYILPKYQRMGIGKILFQQIIEYFSRHNYKKMILWTLNSAKNNSFYKNNGGEITDKKILEIGGKTYDGIGFSFNLPPISN